MKLLFRIPAIAILAALLVMSCSENPMGIGEELTGSTTLSKGGKPGGETAGNNLSYPVIWSEGVQKVLPGVPGMNPILLGEWWYAWGSAGTDPDVVPMSCAPDPDDDGFCDDGAVGTVGPEPGYTEGFPEPQNVLPVSKAFLQKDLNNVWQAESADWSASPVNVHWIDWGDNLESVDWYTRSQVRTEVVLFQDLTTPMREYEMRHVEGWGINEVHGAAATRGAPPIAMQGPGDRATVYSPCARLTIQKLLVLREDPVLEPVAGNLMWVPGAGWDESDTYVGEPLFNPPIFNDAVYLAQDGPGYYNAEINVKGRIIYGYTWNVRRLNDAIVNGGTAAGDYRATFSFDQSCGTASLNTFFVDGVTEIIMPLEEEILAASSESEPGGGAVAQLDYGNNLTFIDIRILDRSGGGGGGDGGGAGGGAGGGGGGHGRP